MWRAQSCVQFRITVLYSRPKATSTTSLHVFLSVPSESITYREPVEIRCQQLRSRNPLFFSLYLLSVSTTFFFFTLNRLCINSHADVHRRRVRIQQSNVALDPTLASTCSSVRELNIGSDSRPTFARRFCGQHTAHRELLLYATQSTRDAVFGGRIVARWYVGWEGGRKLKPLRVIAHVCGVDGVKRKNKKSTHKTTYEYISLRVYYFPTFVRISFFYSIYFFFFRHVFDLFIFLFRYFPFGNNKRHFRPSEIRW